MTKCRVLTFVPEKEKKKGSKRGLVGKVKRKKENAKRGGKKRERGRSD